MKSKQILSLISSIVLGSSIVTASYANHPSTHNAPTHKDGEIIAIVIAVDKNEIAAAKKALHKGVAPKVKQYAQMLKRQHSENLNEALRLRKEMHITPVKTARVISIQQKGAKELVTLSTLKNKNFEKAYVDAMVTGHAHVLKMIDNDLLKNASNASVKKFLLATRPHIKAHLQEGQAIQKELN